MPDMREKVIEYIKELEEEITRVEKWIEEHSNSDACVVGTMEGRWNALTEVKNDLQNRLEELIP